MPYHATGTERERFWRHVRKGEGCWIWTGAKNSYGYGVWWPTKRTQLMAHRVAYKFSKGRIPFGKNVLHRCDNPPCVRPSHLYAGTQKQNSKDMLSRGRGVFPKGPHNGRALLSPEDVREIRRLYRPQRSSATSAPKLAKRYGVSNHCIYSILSGRGWRHL